MTEAGNNYSEKKTQLHISVRNLVEFIFREGDIDNRSSRAMSADAMMEGTRIHRKIQGSMGKEYQAEVPLSLVVEGDLYELTVEGRADGIFTEDGKCFVDEIKGMYRRVELFEKPVFGILIKEKSWVKVKKMLNFFLKIILSYAVRLRKKYVSIMTLL